jgi:hypothetical protein
LTHGRFNPLFYEHGTYNEGKAIKHYLKCIIYYIEEHVKEISSSYQQQCIKVLLRNVRNYFLWQSVEVK